MKKQNKDEKISLLSKIYSCILAVFKEEKCSTAGKFNFAADMLLIFLLICMVLYNTLGTVVQGIQNIFAIIYLGENNSLESSTIFFYFVTILAFTVFCLFFMHFTHKNKAEFKDAINNRKNSRDNKNNKDM